MGHIKNSLSKFLLFSCFILLSVPEVQAAKKNSVRLCADIFATLSSDKQALSWIDLHDNGTNARFEANIIDSDGIFVFSIENYSPRGRRFSDDFRPAEAFHNALKYFGNRVKAIRGSWDGEWDNPLFEGPYASTNYYQFAQAIKANKAPELAVFETWTGKQAQVAGFDECLKVEYFAGDPDNRYPVKTIQEANNIKATFVRPKK